MPGEFYGNPLDNKKKGSEKWSDEADIQNGTIKLAKKAGRYILAIQPPLRPYERERSEKLLRKANLHQSLAAVDMYGFDEKSMGPVAEHRDDIFVQLGVNLENLLGNRVLSQNIVELQSSAQAAAEINEGQS